MLHLLLGLPMNFNLTVIYFSKDFGFDYEQNIHLQES